MSAELVLDNLVYHTVGEARRIKGKGTVVHCAIHDLESFFWVLLYLCLTQKGPGGRLRDELRPNASDKNDTDLVGKLNGVLWCYFDSDDARFLAEHKLTLFHQPSLLETDITPCFHPYFETLKPLVVELWKTIRLGFKTYDLVGPSIIHRLVLDVIKTEQTRIELELLAKPTDKAYKKMASSEVTRRQEDFREIKEKLRSWQLDNLIVPGA